MIFIISDMLIKHIIGNIYIADSYNSRVRKITKSSGIITNIAGTGGYSFSGNGIAATSAVLFIPVGVAVDSTGGYPIFN